LRCAGCFNPSLQPFGNGRSFNAEVLAIRLAKAESDGLTVSGGEPFDQSEALHVLIKLYKELCGRSVVLFTGYEFAELKECQAKRRTMLLADAVLSGRFSKGGLWKNKCLLLLSDRVKPEEMRPERSLELSVSKGEVFASGYPSMF
jgi:anaerobic ribonucleoside-triphosphate reductase activating protein